MARRVWRCGAGRGGAGRDGVCLNGGYGPRISHSHVCCGAYGPGPSVSWPAGPARASSCTYRPPHPAPSPPLSTHPCNSSSRRRWRPAGRLGGRRHEFRQQAMAGRPGRGEQELHGPRQLRHCCSQEARTAWAPGYRLQAIRRPEQAADGIAGRFITALAPPRRTPSLRERPVVLPVGGTMVMVVMMAAAKGQRSIDNAHRSTCGICNANMQRGRAMIVTASLRVGE